MCFILEGQGVHLVSYEQSRNGEGVFIRPFQGPRHFSVPAWRQTEYQELGITVPLELQFELRQGQMREEFGASVAQK